MILRFTHNGWPTLASAWALDKDPDKPTVSRLCYIGDLDFPVYVLEISRPLDEVEEFIREKQDQEGFCDLSDLLTPVKA